jgi:FkbM family methyltransferase
VPSLKTFAGHFVRRAARRLGLTVLHRADDPLLDEMLRCHQALRFQPNAHTWRTHELAKLPAASVLRSLLQHHAIDLVLDIGANEGQFARGLRELGYTGEIISFEPGSAARTRLIAAARGDAAWHVRPEALGATPGEARLHVSNNDVFSSIHVAQPEARALFGTDLVDHAVESVPVRTLDALWPELSGGRPRAVLLKCDTQGHEASILAGARAVLPLINAAVIEGAVRPLYEGCPDWQDLIALLAPVGLTLASVIPLSQRPSDLALLEVDLCFTRETP